MSPMGRPKIDNPKAVQVTARLSAEEVKKLDENAAYYQESRADSLRRGIELVNDGIKKR